jgi:NAD(P)-dependent dehydrogenase (short-subunit alcohol dehydrogenase family)
VRAFAKRFRTGHTRLDLLINNAGVMAIPRQLTRDGFEMQLATNHLGHFALTGLLLPCLDATPSARVVAVSSIAARHAAIAFDNPDGRARLPGVEGLQPEQAGQPDVRAGAAAPAAARRLEDDGGDRASGFGHHQPVRVAGCSHRQAGADAAGEPAVPCAGSRRAADPVRGDGAAGAAGAYYGPDGFQETKGEVALAYVPKAARDKPAAARLWKVSESLTGVDYLSG